VPLTSLDASANVAWKIVTLDRDKCPAVVIIVMNFRGLQNSPNFLLADEMSSSRKIISLIKYSNKIFEMLRNIIIFFWFPVRNFIP